MKPTDDLKLKRLKTESLRALARSARSADPDTSLDPVRSAYKRLMFDVYDGDEFAYAFLTLSPRASDLRKSETSMAIEFSDARKSGVPALDCWLRLYSRYFSRLNDRVMKRADLKAGKCIVVRGALEPYGKRDLNRFATTLHIHCIARIPYSDSVSKSWASSRFRTIAEKVWRDGVLSETLAPRSFDCRVVATGSMSAVNGYVSKKLRKPDLAAERFYSWTINKKLGVSDEKTKN